MSDRKEKAKPDTTELSDEELEQAQGGWSWGESNLGSGFKPKGSPNQIRMGDVGPFIVKPPTTKG